MKSTPQSYYNASLEHLATAQQIFDDSNYAQRYYVTHLLAGLAVECMLRAYLLKKTNEWDARHDLYQLAARSGFTDLFPKNQSAKLEASFAELNKRWRSTHRYAALRDVERHLQAIGAEKHTAGNLIENSSRTMINLAADLINLGASKWRP